MDDVAFLLAKLSTDRLQYAQNIADGTVGILYAHIHHTSMIFNTIEGCDDLNATFTELLPQIPWEYHIGSPFGNGNNRSIVFIFFLHD